MPSIDSKDTAFGTTKSRYNELSISSRPTMLLVFFDKRSITGRNGLPTDPCKYTISPLEFKNLGLTSIPSPLVSILNSAAWISTHPICDLCKSFGSSPEFAEYNALEPSLLKASSRTSNSPLVSCFTVPSFIDSLYKWGHPYSYDKKV